MPACQFLWWATCLSSSLLALGKLNNNNDEEKESLGDLMEGEQNDIDPTKTQSAVKGWICKKVSEQQ